MVEISRRSALAQLTSATICVLSVMSTSAWASKPKRGAAIPRALPLVLPRLKQGDIVGLINSASAADESHLSRARNNIATLGFQIREGKHLLDKYGYLAGQDRDRANDLNAMYADPEVKAVFAMRGGWGSARMLRYLDWDMIRANPKLLIGYSDVTALHLAFAAKAGFPTIHGPNAANGWDGIPSESFRQIAMTGELATSAPIPPSPEQLSGDYRSHKVIAPGKARGKLLGGNLTVLAAMIGTPWMPDLSGAILFIEDIDEAEYRIDRMLTQMIESGLLNRIAGFAFGQCRNCRQDISDTSGGFNLSSVLQQHIAPLGIPAFTGGHFGHVAGQYCLPMGAEVEMDAEAGIIRMVKPIVA
jgi:muramoyltetrapeptide carboxypeptidase